MATIENSKQQEIKQLFQQEVDCANKLLQSLDSEYSALAEYHTSALEEVVREKQNIILQLELISRQREELLAPMEGINISKSTEKNQSYQFNDDAQLSLLWNELISVAEKCREKNRINGSIVELVSKQSRHALDILHGILPNASSASELYDNAGQTTRAANKRSLVQV